MNSIQIIEMEMLQELDAIASKNSIKYYLGYGSALGALRSNGFIPWDTDIDIIVEYDYYDKLCQMLHRELSSKFGLIDYRIDPSYDSLKARVYLIGENHHQTHIDIYPLIGLPSGRYRQIIVATLSKVIYKAYYVKLLPISIYGNNKKKIVIVKFVRTLGWIIPRKLLINCHEILSKKYPSTKSEWLLNSCGCYGVREIIPKSILGDGEMVMFENLLIPVPKLTDAYLRHFYGPDYLVPKKNNYLS